MSPIPVSIASGGGITWTTVLVAVLNLLVGGALVSFIRSRPTLKKIEADREANLLSERAREMAEMRVRIDRMEQNEQQKEKLFEAERALYRHQINNLDGAFSALLMLLKKGVSVEEAVDAIEKMRAEQLARETIEKAALRALMVKAGMADPEP